MHAQIIAVIKVCINIELEKQSLIALAILKEAFYNIGYSRLKRKPDYVSMVNNAII